MGWINRWAVGILAALILGAAVESHAASTVLSWDFPVAEEPTITEFSIEGKPVACATAGTFTELGTVTKTARSYTHNNVALGSTWCYQVRAEGPGGFGPYSNTVARTVPFPVPVAPSNLRAIGGP